MESNKLRKVNAAKVKTLAQFLTDASDTTINDHTQNTMKKAPPTPQVALTTEKKFKSMTIAELGLTFSGVLPKDAIQTPHPRPAVQVSHTTEKTYKPMTMAELRATFPVLNVDSPKRLTQHASTSVKKRWNSSVKLDKKTISHTADGKMKHTTVRKTLNFNPPRPKFQPINSYTSRLTMLKPETPKPEIKMKKPPPQVMAHDISGICPMPEVPEVKIANNLKSREAYKENIPTNKIVKKIATTPKSSLHKKVLISKIVDTPLSNQSWPSSCDDSFIQNEKDIEKIQEKIEAEENVQKNMPPMSPPASTPFREYRNVQDFFNNSSADNSRSCQDDTIMSFCKASASNENSKREESVIVSLCDLLNKARVSTSNIDNGSTELDDLLKIEKQTEENIKTIENSIKLLDSIKESQLKSLESQQKALENVKQLINEKKISSESDKDNTVITISNSADVKMDITPSNSPITSIPCSVIKSCLKSPSYKIPKKNMSSVRKRVTYKSIPIANMTPSPKCMGTKALSVYMKMKERMNFLNTPTTKRSDVRLDTPSITSRNLQKQLDKLYDES